MYLFYDGFDWRLTKTKRNIFATCKIDSIQCARCKQKPKCIQTTRVKIEDHRALDERQVYKLTYC